MKDTSLNCLWSNTKILVIYSNYSKGNFPTDYEPKASLTSRYINKVLVKAKQFAHPGLSRLPGAGHLHLQAGHQVVGHVILVQRPRRPVTAHTRLAAHMHDGARHSGPPPGGHNKQLGAGGSGSQSTTTLQYWNSCFEQHNQASSIAATLTLSLRLLQQPQLLCLPCLLLHSRLDC